MRKFMHSRGKYQTTVNLYLHFEISLCSLHPSEAFKLRNFFLPGKKDDGQKKLPGAVKSMLLLNSNVYLCGEGLFYDSDLHPCYILLHQYQMDFICAKNR